MHHYIVHKKQLERRRKDEEATKLDFKAFTSSPTYGIKQD
jgi:hypothetical protein